MLEDYSSPPTGPTIPHPIPEGLAGIRRMIDICRVPEHRALVAICGLAGARIGEALKVRPSDFNFKEMELRIQGKGEKIRYVPVSSEAWSAMANAVTAAFVAGNTPVVPMDDRNARHAITQLGKAARLSRPVASHDLRATFATAVYDKTKDMRLVQELLGHSSVETTQIYVGVRRKAIHAAVEL